MDEKDPRDVMQAEETARITQMFAERAAPAEMVGEEEIARAAYEAICGCYGTRPNWDDEPAEVKAVHRAQASAILALFALAEKERLADAKARALEYADTQFNRALAAEAALAAERERCAKVADRFGSSHNGVQITGASIAAAIRAQIAAPGAATETL